MEKALEFRQSKGNNSAITDEVAINLHVHKPNIVMCIQYKLYEILSMCYLVMVSTEREMGGWTERRVDRWTDRQADRQTEKKE